MNYMDDFIEEFFVVVKNVMVEFGFNIIFKDVSIEILVG